jgi:hypothetical protein
MSGRQPGCDAGHPDRRPNRRSDVRAQHRCAGQQGRCAGQQSCCAGQQSSCAGQHNACADQQGRSAGQQSSCAGQHNACAGQQHRCAPSGNRVAGLARDRPQASDTPTPPHPPAHAPTRDRRKPHIPGYDIAPSPAPIGQRADRGFAPTPTPNHRSPEEPAIGATGRSDLIGATRQPRHAELLDGGATPRPARPRTRQSTHDAPKRRIVAPPSSVVRRPIPKNTLCSPRGTTSVVPPALYPSRTKGPASRCDDPRAGEEPVAEGVLLPPPKKI